MTLLQRLVYVIGGGDLSPAARRNQLWAMVIGYMAIAVFFAAISGGFWRINLTAAYAVMLALMGSSVLFGQLGLVSLCQFALVGVGGWVALRLTHMGLPFEVGLIGGGVIASLVGVIWGLPALRMRGIYLALVTLMLAGAFQTVISAWSFPAGGTGFFGTGGIQGGQRELMPRPFLAEGDVSYFFYCTIVALLGLILIELHRNAKAGRSWALIKKDPRLAAASGVSILKYQAWAFALAGFLAGVGGGLLAGTYRQLDATAFGASESIVLFAATILGGTTNWIGIVLGGILMRLVPLILNDLGTSAAISTAIFGFALMMAIVGGPEGLAGLFDKAYDKVVDKVRR
jgi:branched-chain amino acid transport system permease protein